MERAVAAKDRAYFGDANLRMQAFLDAWGLHSNPVALERYPMCADAVTDYLIVGLCKISPPGKICEPSTFFPKFEQNLQQCRSARGLTRRSTRTRRRWGLSSLARAGGGAGPVN